MSVERINFTAMLGTTSLGLAYISNKLELNQMGSFEISVANTSSNRVTVENNISEKLYIYKEEAQVLKGRIDVNKIIFRQTEIIISGYAKYIDLHFVFFSKDQGQYDIRRVQFDNISADVILGYVVSGTGYSVNECPTTLISLRGEYETKLQWVSAIAKACKYTSGTDTLSCDWWIDSSDGVHIAHSKGSAKGTLNLTPDLERELDYGFIQNTAYGLGYADGINQLQTVKSNTASVTAYGSREVNMVDRRFNEQAALDDEMQEHTDTHAEPIESVPCMITTYDWYDLDLDVGDTVTIEDENTGISGSYRIKKASIHPVTTDLEITNSTPRLSSELQDIRRQLHIDGSYMQGATNIFQVQSYENCDTTHPLNVRFRLPNDVVHVNKVLFGFKFEDYRAYHSAVTDEGSHTHSLGMWTENASYETFLVGVEDRGGGGKVLVVASGGPSASVSDSGSNHTHPVTFGIHEIALASPSVVVTAGIDGSETAVGTYTADQTDVDIVSNISSVGNWMNVKFVPNKEMRIEANVYVKCFIKSE